MKGWHDFHLCPHCGGENHLGIRSHPRFAITVPSRTNDAWLTKFFAHTAEDLEQLADALPVAIMCECWNDETHTWEVIAP